MALSLYVRKAGRSPLKALTGFRAYERINHPSGYPDELKGPSGYPDELKGPSGHPDELESPSGYPDKLKSPSGYPDKLKSPSGYPDKLEDSSAREFQADRFGEKSQAGFFRINPAAIRLESGTGAGKGPIKNTRIWISRGKIFQDTDPVWKKIFQDMDLAWKKFS